MTKRDDLAVFYDRPVDVLHVVTDPVPYEGDDVGELGVEFDYSLEDDRPVGAKVIGYNRYGWSDRLTELASILSRHLSVDRERLALAIRRRTAE